MHLTYVGHGSMYVEATGCSVFIDPVVTDEFMAGMARPEPRRRIERDLLPRPDVIVVTHFHAGHLEPESLARLPRDALVLVPHDPTAVYALDRLGFRTIVQVEPGEKVTVGETSLSITGVGASFPCIGIVCRDATGTFWYMSDRGDMLSPQDIDATTRRCGRVDVAVISHPSDFHSYFRRGTVDGGAVDGETHESWVARTIAVVDRVGAHLSLPLSTSYSYVGEAAWMNRVMFPMKNREFIALVREVSPSASLALPRPGDVIQIRAPGEISCTPQVSEWVRSEPGEEDPRGVDLTTGTPRPTPDPEVPDDSVAISEIGSYLRETLVPWLNGAAVGYSASLDAMRKAGVRYRLTLELRESKTFVAMIDWEDGSARLHFPAVDDNGPAYNEYHTRISAGALCRWIRNEIPYFVASAHCRRSGRAFEVLRGKSGSVVARRVECECLVTTHLQSNRRFLEEWLTREIDRALLTEAEVIR